MKPINEILQTVYLDNTVADYCIVLGAILVGFIFMKYLSKLVSTFLYKTISKYSEGVGVDEFHKLLSKPLSWLIMLAIIFVATSHIDFPANWNLAPIDVFGVRMVLHMVYELFLVITVARVILRIIDFLGLVLLNKASKTESKQDDQLIPFIVEALKIVVMVFVIFFVMGSVFNVDIGSLIAGLGIGGLALALAAKESLENLLGSFTIFFDKPFVVGDTVKIGGVTGTVEKVGFRSTRLRTPEKSYLTVPNRNMINAELDNISLRTFRRVKITIGLTYSTQTKQIKAIVDDIQQFIDEHKHTNQDGKVKFTDFGASSLDLLVLYYVDTMDWGIFLNVKQEINYKIMEIVEKHGSDFAFPSQTVYLEKSE